MAPPFGLTRRVELSRPDHRQRLRGESFIQLDHADPIERRTAQLDHASGGARVAILPASELAPGRGSRKAQAARGIWAADQSVVGRDGVAGEGGNLGGRARDYRRSRSFVYPANSRKEIATRQIHRKSCIAKVSGDTGSHGSGARNSHTA
jgi:hypothetical protein